MKRINLILIVSTLFLVSCSNPPKTVDETITMITNGGHGGTYSQTDDYNVSHTFIFETNGIFKKSTDMNMNSFMGRWSVTEPGKVDCIYPDGVTLDITVIDEEEFELMGNVYHLTGYREF